MAEQATFTIERNDDRVEIRLVVIPDGPDDEDTDATGISFSRRDAVGFAWKIIKIAVHA